MSCFFFLQTEQLQTLLPSPHIFPNTLLPIIVHYASGHVVFISDATKDDEIINSCGKIRGMSVAKEWHCDFVVQKKRTVCFFNERWHDCWLKKFHQASVFNLKVKIALYKDSYISLNHHGKLARPIISENLLYFYDTVFQNIISYSPKNERIFIYNFAKQDQDNIKLDCMLYSCLLCDNCLYFAGNDREAQQIVIYHIELSETTDTIIVRNKYEVANKFSVFAYVCSELKIYCFAIDRLCIFNCVTRRWTTQMYLPHARNCTLPGVLYFTQDFLNQERNVGFLTPFDRSVVYFPLWECFCKQKPSRCNFYDMKSQMWTICCQEQDEEENDELQPNKKTNNYKNFVFLYE